MAKASMDMVRDVLEWNLEAEQKLTFIRRIVEGTAPAPAVKDEAAQEAPAKPRKTGRRRPPERRDHVWCYGLVADDVGARPTGLSVARKAPSRRRKTGRQRPTRSTRKVQLWAECKKADPEKVKSLSYRTVKTRDLEKMLAKVSKAK